MKLGDNDETLAKNIIHSLFSTIFLLWCLQIHYELFLFFYIQGLNI
jgi:hypothetical protein